MKDKSINLILNNTFNIKSIFQPLLLFIFNKKNHQVKEPF